MLLTLHMSAHTINGELDLLGVQHHTLNADAGKHVKRRIKNKKNGESISQGVPGAAEVESR